MQQALRRIAGIDLQIFHKLIVPIASVIRKSATTPIMPYLHDKP